MANDRIKMVCYQTISKFGKPVIINEIPKSEIVMGIGAEKLFESLCIFLLVGLISVCVCWMSGEWIQMS